MKFGVLTVSDTCFRGEAQDRSGPAVETILKGSFKECTVTRDCVADDRIAIQSALHKWIDAEYTLVLTTGGTGFTERDVTPEATRAVIEKEAPGIVAAMLSGSLKVTPMAMLSRPVAGICKRSIIVNLPGSSKGAVENLEFILPGLPHALQLVRGEDTKSHPAPSAAAGSACRGHHGGAPQTRGKKAELIRCKEVAPYNAEKMGKSTVFQCKGMMVGLNAFEPGQEHGLHAHADMDKVYVVVEGRGLFLLEDQELAMEAGCLLTAPAGVPHGVRNNSGARLLVMATLSPPP